MVEGGQMAIQIIKKGITKLEVDAIVNAANSQLQAGGGVCGAIFEEAGYKELTAAKSGIVKQEVPLLHRGSL